ncbi:MarR family winged helix-turn-helix transcriptional regulator [Micromonospora thermarum]|uniref:MarR family transcriptional regulator n=1 Tax=Micromonospora thermarum TaxID=2720024 RepID=A0ABX0Z6R8_9ACTN|nr:MarR family transcriptional regulator [Micromonospora thermarum]NJP33551.1 MarR family transcriptional regulator [Micromonospora thermarum]
MSSTSSTTSRPPFGTAVIGQTEKALNAILERQLAGTAITEPQWVALTLTVVSGGTLTGDLLVQRISDVLKVDPAVARQRVAELAAADLVRTTPDGVVEPTEDGRALWGRVRSGIDRITQRLWGDLPDADLTTAGRVLTTVLTRANALLAAG